jgi:hypothetical protein
VVDTCPDEPGLGVVLERLLPAIPRGPLLQLGFRGIDRPRVLAECGFAVEVADFSPDVVLKCRAEAARVGVALEVREIDRAAPTFPPARYALALLDGVLSQVGPEEGERLLGAVRRAVRPGGVVCVTVLSPVWRDGAAANRRSPATPFGCRAGVLCATSCPAR